MEAEISGAPFPRARKLTVARKDALSSLTSFQTPYELCYGECIQSLHGQGVTMA